MNPKDGQGTPGEAYSRAANNPPVDGRKPPRRTTPGSHTTGGAKDHALPDEDAGPRHDA